MDQSNGLLARCFVGPVLDPSFSMVSGLSHINVPKSRDPVLFYILQDIQSLSDCENVVSVDKTTRHREYDSCN